MAPQARRKWASISWSRQERTWILIAWTVHNYYFLLYVLSPPLIFTYSGGGGATSCSIVRTTTAASTLGAAASQVHLYRKRFCCANLEIHVEELGGRTCFFTEVTKWRLNTTGIKNSFHVKCQCNFVENTCRLSIYPIHVQTTIKKNYCSLGPRIRTYKIVRNAQLTLLASLRNFNDDQKKRVRRRALHKSLYENLWPKLGKGAVPTRFQGCPGFPSWLTSPSWWINARAPTC